MHGGATISWEQSFLKLGMNREWGELDHPLCDGDIPEMGVCCFSDDVRRMSRAEDLVANSYLVGSHRVEGTTATEGILPGWIISES